MPFRDHFRPPLDLITSREGFDGQWPVAIVQQLRSYKSPNLPGLPVEPIIQPTRCNFISYNRIGRIGPI
jgi:hypothetical protein